MQNTFLKQAFSKDETYLFRTQLFFWLCKTNMQILQVLCSNYESKRENMLMTLLVIHDTVIELDLCTTFCGPSGFVSEFENVYTFIYYSNELIDSIKLARQQSSSYKIIHIKNQCILIKPERFKVPLQLLIVPFRAQIEFSTSHSCVVSLV